MALALQIIIFVVAAGGVVVTAATLSNPFWKKVGIAAFTLLGVLGVVLHLATSETTLPFLATMWAAVVEFSQARIFQIIIALVVGFGIGVAGRAGIWKAFHRLTKPGPDKRVWLTGVEIYAWARERIVGQRNTALDRVEVTAAHWRELERKKEEVAAGLGPYAMLSDPPSPEYADAKIKAQTAFNDYSRATDELTRVEMQIRNIIHEGLIAERFLAKGFLPPFTHQSIDVGIPASQWRFLRFDKDMQTAEGQGVTYIGVSVTDPSHKPSKPVLSTASV